MEQHRDYDVVVVGGGPGGLAAAAYLGIAGRRVLVIDARDEVGGHMSSFTHAGFEFGIGLNFTLAEPVQQVLHPLGIDPDFRDLDPNGMFRLLGPDGEFAVPRGMDAYRARLHGAFPAERQAIDRFLATVDLLAEAVQEIRKRPHLRELPQLPWRLRSLLRFARSTVGGYLDSLRASPQLKAVLMGWVHPSFALPPSRLSLPVAALSIRRNLGGLSYPQGGPRLITDGMADLVRRLGGEILLRTEVSRILVEGGRVRGVRAGSASLDAAPEPVHDIRAPAVVAAIDIKQTYLQLLSPDVVPSRVLRRVRNYELPAPCAVVYLVLGRDLAAEDHPYTVHIVSDSHDIDGMYATIRAGALPEANAVMVSIPSLADPHNPRLCAPGQTNVQLLGLAPARHAWWGIAPGSGPTRRYAARKRQVRDQLIRLAERAIPGLSGSIVHEETATPITDERFMRCTGGTSFGPAMTPRQAFTRLGPSGAVRGLFHAGAGVRPSHGLVGTLSSGVAAAAAVARIPVAELLTGTQPGELARSR